MFVFVLFDESGECLFSFYCLLVVDLFYSVDDFDYVMFVNYVIMYVCSNSLIEYNIY